MAWLVERFHIVLIVSGLLTATMLQFAFAPARALQATFGESLQGPLADMVVRTWGLLIGMVGGMLLWSAFHPETRPMAVVVAVVSKLAYLGLLLAHRDRLMSKAAAVSAVIDAVMVASMLAWLWTASR